MSSDNICNCSCHIYGSDKCDHNKSCCIRPHKKYIKTNGKIDKGNWIDLRKTEKDIENTFPIDMKDTSQEPMLKRALDKWLMKVR